MPNENPFLESQANRDGDVRKRMLTLLPVAVVIMWASLALMVCYSGAIDHNLGFAVVCAVSIVLGIAICSLCVALSSLKIEPLFGSRQDPPANIFR